ncbi:MAG: alanine racemase [bacterium]|nr:alanine racemase [bacterium]
MKNDYTTWVNISKSALYYNIKQLFKIINKKTELMPIIKSNAYGHDFVLIAKLLNKTAIKWIGVVSLDEALVLRKNNIRKRILVLSFFNPEYLDIAIKQNISLTIYSLGAAKRINQIAKRLKKKAKIHIKVDTGTSRLGFVEGEIIEKVKRINKFSSIKIEGIYSHFSDAENTNQSITNKQNTIFNKLISELKKEGVNIKYKHIACSAAIILNKQTHHNLVRSGISIYGLHSIENGHNEYLKLKPVLSWHTKIIQIKVIPKNTYVGYGNSFKTKRQTTIALIPIGYWDGYDRRLSNKGQVLIQGQRCNIVGRVCMNLTMIDVTRLKSVKTDEIVTLIGQQKNKNITVDELAGQIDTINYEVVTRINPLMKRLLIK